MLNPATHPEHDRLNEFTNTIVINQKYNISTKVRTREGVIIRPVYDPEEGVFRGAARGTGYRYFCKWNLDGTSETCPDYDMMEILTEDD